MTGRAAVTLAAALAAALLTGCQAVEPTSPQTAAPKPQEAAVAAPGRIEATRIALIHRGQVTVGMTPDTAFRAFQDLRSGGFESSELPPGFKDGYAARSWEDGQHGFGVILYNGLVVAALYQDQKMSMDDLYALVKEYKNLPALVDYPPRLVTGAKVNYWFWDVDGQRLMICGYRTKENEIQTTECMGDDTVLDGLHISFEQAQRDRDKVDQIIIPAVPSPVGSAK